MPWINSHKWLSAAITLRCRHYKHERCAWIGVNKWIYMMALINICLYTIRMAFIFIFYITSNEFLAHFLAHPPRIYYGNKWIIERFVMNTHTHTRRTNISCAIKIIEIVKWFNSNGFWNWLVNLSLRATIRRNPKLMDAFPFPDDSVIFLSTTQQWVLSWVLARTLTPTSTHSQYSFQLKWPISSSWRASHKLLFCLPPND